MPAAEPGSARRADPGGQDEAGVGGTEAPREREGLDHVIELLHVQTLIDQHDIAAVRAGRRRRVGRHAVGGKGDRQRVDALGGHAEQPGEVVGRAGVRDHEVRAADDPRVERDGELAARGGIAQAQDGADEADQRGVLPALGRCDRRRVGAEHDRAVAGARGLGLGQRDERVEQTGERAGQRGAPVEGEVHAGG
jgi:hypothetical protein